MNVYRLASTITVVLLLASAVVVAEPDMTHDKNACSPCSPDHIFHVNDPAGRNSIVFKSSAPLEDIVGTSNDITGQLHFNPANPTTAISGEFSIPVNSLRSGIPKRDEHIQSAGWLDAGSFPTITLKVVEVNNVSEVKSSDEFKTYEGTVKAEITLHGQTKPVEFPGRLTFLKESEKTKARLPGDLAAMKADFAIKLADFGVTGPAGMNLIGSKVGETISIEVSLMGTNSAGE